MVKGDGTAHPSTCGTLPERRVSPERAAGNSLVVFSRRGNIYLIREMTGAVTPCRGRVDITTVPGGRKEGGIQWGWVSLI